MESQNMKDESKSPLISVVIPIYNRTTTLIESIESILAQTYENFELLLVCDGSPPETLKVIETYENHSKIKIFKYKNNSGTAVRGWNRAIKEAHGEYFAFQDSDDIAECNRLELSLSCMKRDSADVVYGAWRELVEEDAGRDVRHNQELTCPDFNYDRLKNFCFLRQSTVMVKLEALKKVGGFKSNMRYREDHELWLRLANNGYKFKAIMNVLTTLRIHSNHLDHTSITEDEKWFKLMHVEYKTNTTLHPKVAYLIPTCELHGGIKVACQHANGLLKRGYDILFVVTDHTREITWFPNQEIKIVPLSEYPDDIDILIATFWPNAYVMQSLPAKRKIYFAQGDESELYPKGSPSSEGALKIYDFNCEYIAVARWIQKWLKEKYKHEPYYVPNGLDDEIIRKTPVHSKNKKVRVLLEGPIDIPIKGMAEAFEAVKDLDCEVWCVSTCGTPKENWKYDVFWGKLSSEQMKDIYYQCDILLKLSKVEGFGLPPLEMMACGGACVVSHITGHREYAIDGYNALIVTPGDISAAREAVKNLIEDDELRIKLAANGRETATKWTLERTIDILEDVINDGLISHLYSPYPGLDIDDTSI